MKTGDLWQDSAVCGVWCAAGARCAVWGDGFNSISKHNVYAGIFALVPASLFASSQLKPCFTGSSDSLGTNLFVLGPLTRRFSVPFWWRAGMYGYSSNELCFEAPAETFRKYSLSISAPHYSISAFIIALGFIYGAQDKLPSRGTERNPSTLLHRPAQGVQQLDRNENPSFNSYRMAAKAVSP